MFLAGGTLILSGTKLAGCKGESVKGIYGTLFVSGLLGSLGHCTGMCGPLVTMVSAQLRSRGYKILLPHLSYHGARLLVYALLGAVAGAVGSTVGLGTPLSRLAGGVSLILGLGVVLLGLGYLGWLPPVGLQVADEWFTRAMGWTLQRRSLGGVLMLGALNGLLPCGLVYSSMLVAASSGGPLSGALGMLAFGAGTVPVLLVVGLGVGRSGMRARQALARVAGALIMLVGLQLILRGGAALGIVPHWRVLGVMIW
jgi:sulfite exporter TauE/SafE